MHPSMQTLFFRRLLTPFPVKNVMGHIQAGLWYHR